MTLSETLYRQRNAFMEIHPFRLPYPFLAPTQKPAFARWMPRAPDQYMFCAKFSGTIKAGLRQSGTRSGLQSDKGTPSNNDFLILPFPGNIHSRLRKKAT